MRMQVYIRSFKQRVLPGMRIYSQCEYSYHPGSQSFMLCPHNIISLFEKMLTWYNTFKGADFMKRLPIGIENFKELITNDYYYVDKTLLIKDVCNEKVVLYTRPCRFHRNSADTFGIRQEAH